MTSRLLDRCGTLYLPHRQTPLRPLTTEEARSAVHHACATANGIRRRSRRYKNVVKSENGTDDNSRKAMNFVSNVNGMKACCDAHANTTIAIARLSFYDCEGSCPRLSVRADALQEYIPRPTCNLSLIEILDLRSIAEIVSILIRFLRWLVIKVNSFKTDRL